MSKLGKNKPWSERYLDVLKGNEPMPDNVEAGSCCVKEHSYNGKSLRYKRKHRGATGQCVACCSLQNRWDEYRKTEAINDLALLNRVFKSTVRV